MRWLAGFLAGSPDPIATKLHTDAPEADARYGEAPSQYHRSTNRSQQGPAGCTRSNRSLSLSNKTTTRIGRRRLPASIKGQAADGWRTATASPLYCPLSPPVSLLQQPHLVIPEYIPR